MIRCSVGKSSEDLRPLSELNAFYVRVLHVGLVVLKRAVESGDREWLLAELDMLHNITSLLDEEIVLRH